MSTGGPRRAALLPASAAPLAVAALSSALLPGCAAWGALTVLLAISLRLAADRRGRGLLRPGAASSLRALLPFAVALSAWALPPAPGEGAGTFVSVLFAVEVLTLLSPAAAWTGGVLLALSGAEITTVALRLDGAPALAPVLAYAVSLVGALAAFERAASPLEMAQREAGTRRVIAAATPRAQRRPALRAALMLLALGFPFGFLLFAALPPSPAARAAEARREALRHPAHGRGPGSPGLSGRSRDDGGDGFDGGVPDPGSEWRTGARTRMRLGFVERIKDDPTPMLLVRLRSGERGPRPLRLRGLAYDTFTGTEWQRSQAAQQEARTLDGPAWTWQDVAADASGMGLWRVSVTDLVGQPEGPLFLLAEPERVRLGPEAAAARPVVGADGTVYARGPLPAGAVYEEEAREVPRDPAALAAATSTRGSAPLASYGQSPPDLEEYARLAKEAVGEVTAPAVRAERISAWLRRRCAYSLSLPALDRRRPVLDFLERARKGPCEYFASAMTAMLRALGHSARYVVGVRGGEWQESSQAWLFRGTHAHGWTELWLDGLGWQPYDPTPPDEKAIDFDPEGDGTARALPPGDEGDGGESPVVRWLFGRGTGRPGFLRDVRDGVASALGSLSGAVRVALPVLLAAAVALLLRVRRRQAALVAAGVAPSGRAMGPYGRALAALRDAGIVRRRRDTPSEFEGTASRALPPAAVPLRSLTRQFEEQRYGERTAGAEERAKMEEEAAAVEQAARARRKGL